MEIFDFSSRISQKRLAEFADYIITLQGQIPFRVSARGWCYLLEQRGLANKGQFDKIEAAINRCRRYGLVPIDFVAEEQARAFSGIDVPEERSPLEWLASYLYDILNCEEYYNPDWWDGEEYYIQMVVEKIDIRTLFEPLCRRYHIPIANSKGWSSMLQRADYSRRFAEAENKGLQCVLLYFGDHDPDGLRISDFLRRNLEDLKYIVWRDGLHGYDPESLIIERFGLNYNTIKDLNLTWIDNLITGRGKDLAHPSHKNFTQPYVRNYISKYGRRKCEANALVTQPNEAADLAFAAITKYLGEDAEERFERKRDSIAEEIEGFRRRTGLRSTILDAIDSIPKEE